MQPETASWMDTTLWLLSTQSQPGEGEMTSNNWMGFPRRRCGRAALRRAMGVIPLVAVVPQVLGCAPKGVPPAPKSVQRIAVLPPLTPGSDKGPAAGPPAGGNLFNAPRLTLGDVLSAAARLELVRQGFQVVDPITVDSALHGRAPTSAQMAAQMVREAQLNATTMFIDVRLWEPNNTGMRTDGVIVAMDVTLVDPQTGTVMWEVHRAPKPVPLYGVLLQGQADVFVAETVMREILAPLGGKAPAT